MDKIGKVPEFVQGLRVTDAETVEIAEMVLGLINKEIVARINQHGGKAIGLSGKDANLILAEKQETQVTDENGQQTDVDLGFVGKIIGVNTESVMALDKAGYIPIIAPIGVGVDGQTYNINADTMAGEIASAFQAEKLIMLTDTRGILRDLSDTSSLMPTIHMREVNQLIEEDFIAGGMRPKVEACTTALMGGVYKTHIIDGRIPHSLLLEIFTEGGIGTEIVR
jgi:acetylglutamate kinase